MEKVKPKNSPRDFKRIHLDDLRQGRRGKHHDAVMPIIDEVAALAESEAIILPLDKLDIPLANLRSALVKAASTRALKISTYSDESSLYVWRKTAGSRAFERAPKHSLKTR